MIKTLMKSIREYKKPTVLTPLFVMLEVVMEVLIPLMMAKLIDFGIDTGDMDYIIRMGIALLVSALMSLAFGAIAGRTAAVASNGFAKNLRHDMYYNIQDFSFSNIDKFSSSGLVTRLTTDVTNVQQSYQMLTRMAIRAPFTVIFSLVFAFGIDWKLSLIFCAGVPLLITGVVIIMRKVRPLFSKVFKTYDKLNGVVQENLRGVRVVKAYVREEHEKEKFFGISGKIYDIFVKAEKTVAFMMPLMQFCMYACVLLISWFGARAIIASGNNSEIGLSTGELMSLISYTMQILGSLVMVSMIFVMLTLSRASAERITEVLNEKSELSSPANAEKEIADGSIEFKNVDFTYSQNAGKLCLDNINIKINSGETVGILGGTGSSKTTFVSLIPRLYDVNGGQVLVGGRDVREYDLNKLRDAVSVVLQKNVLFSGTVKENLRWGDENATDEMIKNACVASCADEFVSALPQGYDTFIEQGGSNVSGGQKQRLCIARDLLKKPKILILDDSTSAVDTKTDAQIRGALRNEMPDTTKLIIAQRVASVMDADKIIILDDGKIADCGTHEELLARCDIYKEVYTSQIKEGDNE